MPFILILTGYLLGSIPFGYLTARFFLKIDIREHGSGNIGATNILRVVGWKAALPVFLLDIAKGAAAVALARHIDATVLVYLLAGFAAMVGHSFPVFLKFKGGKAAATGVGVLGAISLPVTLTLLGTFVAVIAISRYVSLGSITCAVLAPILFYLFGYSAEIVIFALLMGLLVIARHHQNITRLIRGTESKLGSNPKNT